MWESRTAGFGEDALRILRGLRFAAELGVTVHPDTAVAIHRNRELLRAIAPERIWAELKKLVSGKWAAEVLRAYPGCGWRLLAGDSAHGGV